jgi:hypothetical protein
MTNGQSVILTWIKTSEPTATHSSWGDIQRVGMSCDLPTPAKPAMKTVAKVIMQTSFFMGPPFA